MLKWSKKVMVFGVFDGLHPGHRAFLQQAKRHGGKLIVVVARDSTVKKLKRKMPKENEGKRLAAVRKVREVNLAILGDIKQGSYGTVKKYRPAIICLGYDQHRLKTDLENKISRKKLPVVKLSQFAAHKPRKFHTSLLQ